MRWLDLFSQFDLTIHYVPRNSNVIADALSCRPDLVVVVGSVKSGLLTRILEA